MEVSSRSNLHNWAMPGTATNGGENRQALASQVQQNASASAPATNITTNTTITKSSRSLKSLGKLSLHDFFPIAIQTTELLADIHQKGIIHKDLSYTTVRVRLDLQRHDINDNDVNNNDYRLSPCDAADVACTVAEGNAPTSPTKHTTTAGSCGDAAAGMISSSTGSLLTSTSSINATAGAAGAGTGAGGVTMHGNVRIQRSAFSSRVELAMVVPPNSSKAMCSRPESLGSDLCFVSPEQTGRMNRIVDNRSDLYSYGIVLFYCLTGELPFYYQHLPKANATASHHSSNFAARQQQQRLLDPLELVHAHIALVPPCATDFDPTIPSILADMVAKLLEKNADDRYQSALGLKYDLERAYEQYTGAGGRIDPFPLAMNDYSGRLIIPNKLYGRDAQVAILLESFTRVAKASKLAGRGQRTQQQQHGYPEILLVAGYSGTGKTALVGVTHKPITERAGHFISGKFDQLRGSSLPYHAFVTALDALVRLLLTKPEHELRTWRCRIQKAVGMEGGRVLLDWLPNLHLLLEHGIHQAQSIPELAGLEAQNRFAYVLRLFFRAISCQEHPLVLFLDDMQWADSGSLNLLKTLATDPNNSHLLLICAYRDNETSPSHPFIRAVDEIQETLTAAIDPKAKQTTSSDDGDYKNIHKLQIENLNHEDVTALITETLQTHSSSSSDTGCCDDDTHSLQELADLVYEKTSGNSFFLRQFLWDLYEKGQIQFDWGQGRGEMPSSSSNMIQPRWKWDSQAIREQMNVTDNVVDFMARKIKRLSREIQRSLHTASLIGSRFDISTVAVALGHSTEQTQAIMGEAMVEGLVVMEDESSSTTNPTFSFIHDRVQQAAYSLTSSETERAALHYRIGSIILSEIHDKDAVNDRIFDIVDQLNWGIDLVAEHNDEERLKIARLNLVAGRKAEDSSAYAPAYQYVSTGIQFLGHRAWEDDYYDLTLQLYTKAANTAYMSAKFEKMDIAIAVIFDKAKTLLDKIPSYRIRIVSLKARNELLDAIDTGLDILRQLGIVFCEATGENTAAELGKILQLLEGKKKEDLLHLPTMDDPYNSAALEIMSDINSSVYWARAELFPFIVFKSVEISVQHGNTQVSSFAYGTFGVILSGVVGDMKRAYEFGELGIEIMNRFAAKAWLAQIYTPHYALIVHWSRHTKATFKPLIESIHIGLETGAIEYAMINANIYCIHGYLSGQSGLRGLAKEMEDYSSMMKNAKQETNYNFNQIYQQAVLNLQGRSEDPCKLAGSAYDENEMLPRHLKANDMTASFFVFFNKMILCYLFGELETAASCRDEAEARLSAVLAKLENTSFNFFDSLLCLAQMRQASANDDNSNKRDRVEKNQTILQKWAHAAPMNFQHKYDLVEAERARLAGQTVQAHEHYKNAIQGANEHGYLNDVALANELAADYFLGIGFKEMGVNFLQEAFAVYDKWEAAGKMHHLAKKYPEHLSFNPKLLDSVSLDTEDKEEDEYAYLDLFSVMKAAGAIQGEIQLSKFLRELMSVLIENAGADRGSLMLVDNGQMFVQAEHCIESDKNNMASTQTKSTTTVLQGLPVEHAIALPQSVVSYVARSLQPVVIDEGREDETFGQDPYIVRSGPTSIHCSPLVLRGELLAIVYLENHVVAGAFTEERIGLLNLLSGHIAISIHNALMYDRLEQKVKERTAELEEQKRKLEVEKARSETEKARSDELLLNILPKETAEELKTYNKTQARRHDNVTVLFSDIVNFTQLSAERSPEKLVSELDQYFCAMDDITTGHRLEKIKTVGDAYLVAGGLPVADPEGVFRMISAAGDMISFVESMKQQRAAEGGTYFDIRIGVHTGSLVAGVVGSRKFAYDIFGETVNIAARMESSGKANKINISNTTYDLVKDRFQCTHRGRVAAKNMGERDMYFVDVDPSMTAIRCPEKVIRRGTKVREDLLDLQTMLQDSLDSLDVDDASEAENDSPPSERSPNQK